MLPGFRLAFFQLGAFDRHFEQQREFVDQIKPASDFRHSIKPHRRSSHLFHRLGERFQIEPLRIDSLGVLAHVVGSFFPHAFRGRGAAAFSLRGFFFLAMRGVSFFMQV